MHALRRLSNCTVSKTISFDHCTKERSCWATWTQGLTLIAFAAAIALLAQRRIWKKNLILGDAPPHGRTSCGRAVGSLVASRFFVKSTQSCNSFSLSSTNLHEVFNTQPRAENCISAPLWCFRPASKRLVVCFIPSQVNLHLI